MLSSDLSALEISKMQISSIEARILQKGIIREQKEDQWLCHIFKTNSTG